MENEFALVIRGCENDKKDDIYRTAIMYCHVIAYLVL